jgi:hypothetical protein
MLGIAASYEKITKWVEERIREPRQTDYGGGKRRAFIALRHGTTK